MGLVVIYVIADDIIIQIHLLYIQVLINIQINKNKLKYLQLISMVVIVLIPFSLLRVLFGTKSTQLTTTPRG